ncbi:YncE family protein [Compostibacter hankyongensis]|uniref:YncE family protein n=1 Tax=Compostibacter hankyongensis TaxID=1007089 RepID=A0ABP8G0S2_9BACT
MNRSRSLKWLIPALFLLNACSKDDNPAPRPPEVKPTHGVYVLSEGSFGGNNTVLSYYDFAMQKTQPFEADLYRAVNGEGLGDTGNDLLIYGNKMYVVMNVSSYVAVLDAATAKRIDSVSFTGAGGKKREPRYAVGAAGKVFVSASDGTVTVIDTATLTAEKQIRVGNSPEGMAVSGNSLYVANSGWKEALTGKPYDSTVSVIDLSTLSETKRIVTGINPRNIQATASGMLYVSTSGNYQDVHGKLYVIDGKTQTLDRTLDRESPLIAISGRTAYLYNTNDFSGKATLAVMDTETGDILREQFITDGTKVQSPYGVCIDDSNGDVYITDARDYTASGEVFCFDKEGKKKFSFSVRPGVSPNHVAFLR